MLDKYSLVSIIDADTLVYLCAYRAKDEDNANKVLANVDTFVQSILTNTSCTHYIAFLGGTKCFRYDIAVTKPYKGNRPASPDWYVKWGGVIKAHLRDVWHFQVVNGIEADDAVSIASEELKFIDINHILVHGDKDIRQKSGNHYNLRTHKREWISEVEAHRNLFKQILTGDTTDGIQGLPGIGKKKASQYIDGIEDWREMAKIVYQLFENKYHDDGKVYREMHDLCYLLCFDKCPELNGYKLDYIEVSRPDLPKDTTMDEIIADIWG
jgi:5'-3' exonuclease